MIDLNDPLYKFYSYGTRYGIRLTGRCFGVHGLAAYYEHITDQFGMREGDES